MRKIKLYFPLVEAGMGHIMPANSVIEIFKEKYGNDERIEIISDRFFGDSTDPVCHKYEKGMIDALKSFQKCHAWGYFANWWDTFFWGPKEISFFTIRGFNPGTYSHLRKRFDEIDPDIVFSTHWITNYLAMNSKKEKRPYSIMFCPDCRLDRMFSYKADLKLISTKPGLDLAMGKWGHTPENFKKVPFCIRNEAFKTERDKKLLRKEMGLPENKFTLVVVEGAYGNGRLKAICKSLVNKDIPLTLIAVCGKNPKLVEYLKTLKVHSAVTFVPLGFTPVILNYISASDLYLGKSGNGINESTFFGVPAIITSYTNYIEQYIGEYFINYVGSAQKCSNVKKIAKLIESYSNNPKLLEPFIKNCEKVKDNYGAEQTADIIYQKIKEQFFNKE